jgi:hypothetical protein
MKREEDSGLHIRFEISVFTRGWGNRRRLEAGSREIQRKRERESRLGCFG